LKFKQGLTDENNDFDGLLVAIIFATVLGCGLTMYDVFHKGKDFDFEKFGNGVAFIIGAGGLGYGAKRLGEKHNGTSPTDS
jgi:hypothetical protein